MSSKSVHTIAGLAIAGSICYYYQPQPLDVAAIFVGAWLGSSAPDWLEIASAKKVFHFFRPNETVRESIIPHRTITHTVSLWLALAILAVWYPMVPMVKLIAITFLLSAMGHLLLDFSTPMGVPFLPLGRLYWFTKFSIKRSTVIQRRSGWFV